LGYQQAGFDIRLAVEWDTKAADVYRRNFHETPMFVGDIADLTSEEALEITGLEPGELDVLDGSPPCQGFSTAGRRKYEDSRNRLFEQYVRMIDVFRPKMLVMENVSGLRKGKMKLMFAEMTIALKQAGYKVSCRELNAWWYGVPQDRRRLIWVGVREDLDMEPGHPEPTVKKPVSVREALGILYDADISPSSFENCKCGCNVVPRSIDRPQWIQTAGARFKIEMRNPDFENKWKDGDGVGPTLMSSRPPTITGSFGHRDYLAEPENAGRWRSMDEPVATIAAMRPPSVNDGREVRYLTIEESKTLQGFPEWFQVKENEYKFIGNSVCPPMAEALGRHLLRLLDTG